MERCTKADRGKIYNAGKINDFFITKQLLSFPIDQSGSQYVCVLGRTLGAQHMR
jgi:hypothetical protein